MLPRPHRNQYQAQNHFQVALPVHAGEMESQQSSVEVQRDLQDAPKAQHHLDRQFPAESPMMLNLTSIYRLLY
jgi:hypothetical protein